MKVKQTVNKFLAFALVIGASSVLGLLIAKIAVLLGWWPL